MATECTSGGLVFQGPGRREIRADFNGGDITSDAGVLLLQEVERRCAIVEQFAHCFDDHRDASRVEHNVRDLLAQRVFALALGYEDLNDHDELRFDPLLAAAIGKADDKIDINRITPKRDLDFTVDTRRCRVIGFANSFRCGDAIHRSGSEAKKAEIVFYVDVNR